ncbi:MAG: UDP-N-acetylmuramate dehydrogenase [Anaerolineales bacterium]|nr:UDP-N-acetylmuramate dehydrogenase [Anaerolineales bacterium]
MALRSHVSMVYMNDKVKLRAAFGARLKENEPLAKYTAARIGGPAEFLVTAESADELAEQVRAARQLGLRPFVLGGGANILVSDTGLRGLVILNRARRVELREQAEPPAVWAEAGVNLGLLARQCAARGLGGLEWAASVPGTVGGAVYGNAGAHGGDIAGSLRMAEILHLDGTVRAWTPAELAFEYRSSALKRQKAGYVILAAEFGLERGAPEAVQARLESFVEHRKRTQPPGASLGSMFKNPPGDYAGRLLEAAGLKGARVGQAEISPVHANFFINQGEGRAADVFALIHLAHDRVKEKFNVDLELEVELVGEWGGQC